MLSVGLSSLFGRGQTPFEIPLCSSEPDVGYIIDHTVWEEPVAQLKDFHAPWDGKKDDTFFQCFFSADYFYFRFRVNDTTLTLVPDYKTKMDVGPEDRAEIFLSPTAEMQRYYGAEIDPLGRVLDYTASYFRKFDYGWSFSSLECETRIEQGGYLVGGRWSLDEWRTLGLDPAHFYMGVFRADFDGPAVTWYSALRRYHKKADFHIPSQLFPARLK